mgnify:CR=1 FL=1
MYVLYHICTVKGVKCMYESLSLSLSLSAVMRIRAWKRSLGSLYRSEAPHSSTASAFANAATKNSPICSPQQWHHSHFSSSSPLCCFSRTLRGTYASLRTFCSSLHPYVYAHILYAVYIT